MGDAIKYLYSQFILRDVLSFITPGMIVILSIVYVFNDSFSSLSIHWIFLIPLFGLSFAVGFAVQCFGEIVGVVRTQDLSPSKFSQRLGFFSCKWDSKEKIKNNVWWKTTHKETVKILKIIQGKDREWARQQHERLVVLKQMCANNFLAIIFAVISIGISYCSWLWLQVVLIVVLLGIPLLSSLLWGHRVHVIRQITMDEAILKEISNQ